MSAERETTQTATDNTARLKNRRFVGIKETVAYVLEDTAQSLNIDDFKERYIYDVVKIDFTYLAIQNIVATVWDTVNDSLSVLLLKESEPVGVNSDHIFFSVSFRLLFWDYGIG